MVNCYVHALLANALYLLTFLIPFIVIFAFGKMAYLNPNAHVIAMAVSLL
jgi:hypothetical protein